MIPLLLTLSTLTNPINSAFLEEPSNKICVDMEPELINSVEFGDIDEDAMYQILIRCFINYS